MIRASDCSIESESQLDAPATGDFTFRDPAGQLRLMETQALRLIRPPAVQETIDFLDSRLRSELERSGDLITTEIAEAGSNYFIQPGEFWLRHPLVEPISYPWEWTVVHWRAAAELTLRVADRAIDAGWILKDATPLNIVFDGPRPVLVDVLSFERRDPQSKVWLAYGQFVRTFLLPLLAKKLLSWPLQASLFARDGYEPRAIYQALRPWQRLHPDLLDIVTLATLFENRGSKTPAPHAAPTHSDPELITHILHKRIARLRKQLHNAAAAEPPSRWSAYPQSATHYQASDTDEKMQFVQQVLAQFRPSRVLDIGANTGAYSLAAARSNARVVSLDSDAAALEVLLQAAKHQNAPVTALVANIARPTPAAGWQNQEQMSLLQRLTGKFDLVLMLAVIHHLILREQLPLTHISELCASLTQRWLLLEWVPVSDPMYQEWLRGREALYGQLCEDDLLRAFGSHFSVAERTVLGNQRILLLLERTSPATADIPTSQAC
ncbi:MAG TPA: class I SAM-dependent methyltransferase [Terracidiphilus sp.]|jgi:2-polyprenyl-3-methyl-5-hydroxy-6-metoxy-1,4-benzoquinol methylase|nr:class I SAM-dependent methyltransferase [Terracidiphilus sp.]